MEQIEKDIIYEHYTKYDEEVERLEANCTCKDYFRAGWDACESFNNYKNDYRNLYEKYNNNMKFATKISVILFSNDDDLIKVRKIQKLYQDFFQSDRQS